MEARGEIVNSLDDAGPVAPNEMEYMGYAASSGGDFKDMDPPVEDKMVTQVEAAETLAADPLPYEALIRENLLRGQNDPLDGDAIVDLDPAVVAALIKLRNVIFATL